ncbi:CPBP family intramembrane metalloprotease [Lentilactobacillus buchneri]|uniref:CAAX prenyl protease 2/Lysostaphin resistance protein A-like domain-containing protein n=2 Tax=Lentilactobacillus buchneri TaxID=1581 RepID=A0A4R5NLR4_LENBU|nr:CPBP family intramembrane glutamic endopeptidase [Lentilactobacillus buchneri]AEB74518.1 Abortive infection protein [Lentilactobacillus buchneri NRRL B-30929]MCT2882959.1 CPBP family intramembrane metalloprotease [Lentilactobacillus buchneri]MCT2899231.1 CPBP family intramembrane metalloprotease [Lentilactobacillus buchneri]MCT3253720.1 CPBP family intramembrane metalloprotease [Lentilactobacillus buchneri]MCT3548234.1 CPBP family intramembrane metalloprotease [Lentilactobacillus buchneri]
MTTFYLSYVFLIVLWFFGRELINFIEHHYTTGMASDLVSLGIKAVIMVGLGLFWISRTNAQLWIDKRKLYNGNFPTVFWVVLAMFIAYLFFLMFGAHHGFYIQPNPFKSGEFLSVTLGAGLIEEFLFRGFLMNFLMKRYGIVTANIIQAILFQISHFPLYYLEGLTLGAWLINIANVLPLGLIFGWMFYRTKNLWPSTILHCVWDSGVTLFI